MESGPYGESIPYGQLGQSGEVLGAGPFENRPQLERPGQIIFPSRHPREWYSSIRELGKGGFGRVILVYDDRYLLRLFKSGLTINDLKEGDDFEEFMSAPFDQVSYSLDRVTRAGIVKIYREEGDVRGLVSYLSKFKYESLLALHDFLFPRRDDLPDFRLELLLFLVSEIFRTSGETPSEQETPISTASPVSPVSAGDILYKFTGDRDAINNEALRPVIAMKIMETRIKKRDSEEEKKEKRDRMARISRTEVFAQSFVGCKAEILYEAKSHELSIHRPMGCVAFDDDEVPSVSCMFDYFHSNESFFIAMAYIPGKDLADLIQEFTPVVSYMSGHSGGGSGVGGPEMEKVVENYGGIPGEFVWYCAFEMAQILRYIHDQGILHNDVKLENILRDSASGALCLIDFGLACKMTISSAGQAFDGCKHGGGSPYYASYEQVTTSMRYPATDIWALGIVLWQMATGLEYTVPGKTAYEVFRYIGLYRPLPDVCQIPMNFPMRPQFMELLKRIFSSNYQKRPSTHEIIDLLSRLFFSKTSLDPNELLTMTRELKDRANQALVDRLFEIEMTGQRLREMAKVAEEKPEPMYYEGPGPSGLYEGESLGD